MFQKHVSDFDKGKVATTCNNLISLKFSLPANIKSNKANRNFNFQTNLSEK